MNYVKSISELKGMPRPWIFLAGGTGGENWQEALRKKLEHVTDGTLINPRCDDYPTDEEDIIAHTEWEHKAMWSSDVFSVWFTAESMQPLSMFELGTHLTRFKLGSPPLSKLVIGIHPDYARRQDVEIQADLIIDSMLYPAIEVVNSLDAHASVIEQYIIELVD